MDLSGNRDYLIKLECLDCDKVKYPLLNNGYLRISDKDIKDSIVTCGIVPADLNNVTYYKRIDEIRFKQHLICMAIKEEYRKGDIHLQVDDDALEYLDTSEKTLVSYYLGMIFAKIASKKLFGIKYLVHMKRFREAFSINPTMINGGSEPDLVGLDRTMSQYSLFEAKGRAHRSKGIIAEATKQLNNIGTIAGQVPGLRVASLTYPLPRSRDIKLLIKDPDQRGEKTIDFEKNDYLWFYQNALVELTTEIEELSKESREYTHSIDNGMINTTALIDNVNYSIQISEETKEWVVEYKKGLDHGTVVERVFIEKIE